jgi:hypothetical protein
MALTFASAADYLFFKIKFEQKAYSDLQSRSDAGSF